MPFFKSLIQANRVLKIHEPTQFLFANILQLFEKKIVMLPFHKDTDNSFALPLVLGLQYESLTDIIVHTTGKTNERHYHAISCCYMNRQIYKGLS